MNKYGLVSLVFLALFVFDFTAKAQNPSDSNHFAAPPPVSDKAETKRMADLAVDDTRKVLNALDKVEESPRPGTNALLAVRKLLSDPRPSVREKAARVLGALHADVNHNDIIAICRMLRSYDKHEADEALKALRGLNAAEAIPEIIPLLKSPQTPLVREACRTLATIGNKELIPSIEPLLDDKRADVRKEAQEAIIKLKAKPGI
jgi:HEAT repeat protein